MGTVGSNFVFYGQMVSIFTIMPIGALFDSWGRRNTFCFAFVGLALFNFMTPLVAPSITCLIFVNIGLTICLNGPYSSPLVPDYVKKSSRGKAVGL
jgi:MFS family permease